MKIFFLILIILTSIFATSKDIDSLSKSRIWLKLLHYNYLKYRSEVLDNQFFLDKNGSIDPKAELIATLKNYNLEFDKDIDLHPICRFPARYYWLSKELNLIDYEEKISNCTKLIKWGLDKKTSSISLVLVSGYFGNPASTFGHSFLKLNSDEDDRLFQSSINYGALIPKGDSVLKYIYKGITGGYEAGFSDRYFYTQDMTYSNTEFRDMWEYRLNLSKYQKELLILHLWEIVGKKFQYFFFTKNCAYRISSLIDLILDDDFFKQEYLWYVPVETFISLDSLKNPIIDEVIFIPSAKRELYNSFKNLSNIEQEIALAIINGGFYNYKNSKLSTNEKQNLLDFTLDYQYYKSIEEQPNVTKETKRLKRDILLERLKLPPKSREILKQKESIVPTKWDKPSNISIALSNREYKVRFYPYGVESLGRNSLEGDEIIFFDLSIAVNRDINRVILDKFTLLKIDDFNLNSIGIDDENSLSWRLLGEFESEEDNSRLNSLFLFGVGKALKLDRGIIYAMSDFSANYRYPHFRVMPNIGILFEYKSIKSKFSLGFENFKDSSRFDLRFLAEIQSNISTDTILNFKIEKRFDTQSTLELKFRF